ncbi:hypothetical protein [Stutzerimonas tarimensis]|uniref:DUF2232 domain-containing protein n=1 Tax=Stutzerimonas tarimensis TaxID=1507735 RepID=A0ABV7T176_9GAMM
MRALADFVMRGRKQATLVVVASAALPMLFWLSAAVSSLVLLRRGLSDSLGVVAWALLPGAVWWYLGDPRVPMVLLGTLALALALRSELPWRQVMLYSVGLGVVYALVLGAVFDEPIASLSGEVQKLLPQALPGVWEQMSGDEQARLEAVLTGVITGLLAALLQMLTLVSLMLGRYWQGVLYNPGGFGREFRELRFPPLLGLTLLAATLLGPNLGAGTAMLTPLCSVPLMFAGLALVHGLVAQGRLGRFWLIGMYVTLVLFVQLLYPLLAFLAVVDSLLDFRGRASRNRGSGPENG